MSIPPPKMKIFDTSEGTFFIKKRYWIVALCLFSVLPTTHVFSEFEQRDAKLSNEDKWLRDQLFEEKIIEGEDAQKIFDILIKRSEAIHSQGYCSTWYHNLTSWVQFDPPLDNGMTRRKKTWSDREKICHKDKYVRMEGSEDGKTKVVIYHPDGTVYRYNPDTDTYSEFYDEDYSQAASTLDSIKENIDVKVLGTDIVEGNEVVVSEVSLDNYDQIQKVWVRLADGIMVRLEMLSFDPENETRSRMVVETTDIDAREVPDSLFEIPKDKIVEANENGAD